MNLYEKIKVMEKITSIGCKKILQKMINNCVIGGKHLPSRLCLRWIKHLPKEEHKKAIRELNDCIKEGIILTKPKPSDMHFSLNPDRVYEVKQMLGEMKDDQS